MSWCHETVLIPVENHHLHTVDLGQGTPILMHDGWVASWELWLPMIERMQSRWRCIALDHRGAGATTLPPSTISADALVDDVFRVLDAHDVDRCVIAGESLGSLACVQAALREPSRFAGMVLIGSMVRAPALTPEAEEEMTSDWSDYVAQFVAACLPEPDAEPLRRLGRNTLVTAGPVAAAQMTRAHAGISPDFAGVTTPTLVVHGTLDVIAPLEGARQVAATIPGASLVELEGAGHVPLLTRPLEVVDALSSWWSRVSSGA